MMRIPRIYLTDGHTGMTARRFKVLEAQLIPAAIPPVKAMALSPSSPV